MLLDRPRVRPTTRNRIAKSRTKLRETKFLALYTRQASEQSAHFNQLSLPLSRRHAFDPYIPFCSGPLYNIVTSEPFSCISLSFSTLSLLWIIISLYHWVFLPSHRVFFSLLPLVFMYLGLSFWVHFVMIYFLPLSLRLCLSGTCFERFVLGHC